MDRHATRQGGRSRTSTRSRPLRQRPMECAEPTHCHRSSRSEHRPRQQVIQLLLPSRPDVRSASRLHALCQRYKGAGVWRSQGQPASTARVRMWVASPSLSPSSPLIADLPRTQSYRFASVSVDSTSLSPPTTRKPRPTRLLLPFLPSRRPTTLSASHLTRLTSFLPVSSFSAHPLRTPPSSRSPRLSSALRPFSSTKPPT